MVPTSAPWGRSHSSPRRASIASSTSSGSLVPPRAKNLMPLSAAGLWEAEIITPRSTPLDCTRWARPGVGRIPASSTSTPAPARPALTAAERKSPEGRVSRATIARGREPPKAPKVPRTWAAPTDSSTASSAVMSPFARPRTPSVPNSRAMAAGSSRGRVAPQGWSGRWVDNSAVRPVIGQRHDGPGLAGSSLRRHRRARSGPTAAGAPADAPPRRPGTRRIRGRPPHRDAGAFWPERSLARRMRGGNCRADQRLEYCGALRALLSPAFLRSMIRASRVREPAFLRVGRLLSTSISFSARATPRRTAPAWTRGPPPRLASRTVVVHVDLVQRTCHTETDRAGLAGGAAAGDADDHVEAALQVEGGQRIVHLLLVQLVREVGLQIAAVDGPLAGAGEQTDAGDGTLAAAGAVAGSGHGLAGADRGLTGGLGGEAGGDVLVGRGVEGVRGGGLGHGSP